MSIFVEGADFNIYYYLTSPRNKPRYNFDYGDTSYQVRFATYGTNVVPSVGDIVEGNYGYSSLKGRVTLVKPVSLSFPITGYNVHLEEVIEPILSFTLEEVRELMGDTIQYGYYSAVAGDNKTTITNQILSEKGYI